MNNYNQYGSYPYYSNNYGYNQQPYYQNQQYYQQAQQRQKIMPLVYVNGLVGAKAYIVSPNEKIYLKDSESNMIYVKTANQEGISNIEAFELVNIPIDTIGQPKQQDNTKFAKESDLFAIREEFKQEIDKLSSFVKSLSETPKNKEI